MRNYHRGVMTIFHYLLILTTRVSHILQMCQDYMAINCLNDTRNVVSLCVKRSRFAFSTLRCTSAVSLVNASVIRVQFSGGWLLIRCSLYVLNDCRDISILG